MASRAGGSRRLSDRSLAEKKFRSMFRGRICLAHGSVALLCTRRLSVVLALAAAVPAVDFDAPARHLDSEHPPHIPPMALARARASLGVASRLGILLEYGCVAGSGAIIALRRVTRLTSTRCSTD